MDILGDLAPKSPMTKDFHDFCVEAIKNYFKIKRNRSTESNNEDGANSKEYNSSEDESLEKTRKKQKTK